MATNYEQLVFSRQELLAAYEASEEHCDNPEWASKRNTLRAEISKVTKELFEIQSQDPQQSTWSEIYFKVDFDKKKQLWRFDIFSVSGCLLLEGREYKRQSDVNILIKKLKHHAATAPIELKVPAKLFNWEAETLKLKHRN